MDDPLQEPIPMPEDCRTLIKSPDRIFRWMQGTGEFHDQPISPSNHVSNYPPSGNQYRLDTGVILRSPSVGSRPYISPHNVFAAAFTDENMQNGVGFGENNQQLNQETLDALPSHAENYQHPNQEISNALPSHAEHYQHPNQEILNALPSQALVSPQLAEYHEFSGELEQHSAHRHQILLENSPLPNSEDNAHQGIHDRNYPVEDPYNSTAFQNTNDYATSMMFFNNFTSQPRYDGMQPPSERAHQPDMATGVMAPMNIHFSQPHYGGVQPPSQRPYQPDMATGMMNNTNNHFSQPHYGGVQPLSERPHQPHMMRGIMNTMVNHFSQPLDQRAHQMDMTTGMMNPMNDYQGGIHGQDLENNLVPAHHINRGNGIGWRIPQYQEVQHNDHMLHNNNMSPTQQAVQSSGNHMPTDDPTTVILNRFEDTPYRKHPGPYQEKTTDDHENEEVPHSSLITPSQWALQQYRAAYPVPDTTSDYDSDQRTPRPGPVGTGLDVRNVPSAMLSNQHISPNEQGSDVPNVPGNMLQSQHIVHNEQELDVANVLGNMLPNQHVVRNDEGDMPASGGDEMDTTDNQILSDTPQPFNAINSGPSFPQDASPRQPLQLGSNPTLTSSIGTIGAALDSREIYTGSAMYFTPNIPSTLASNVHGPQMETPRASNPFKHPARNEKSDTRKNSSRGANRVNKSIRRRKPAKSQILPSAIGNRVSQLLEESTSQAVEAQNDPEIPASQAVEAQDESQTSVE